ncbi:uncharacterized protein LOC120940291 isoform X2 [Rana temporaria]|uniref:uncharacterized protein LOC120940291 isoform X2 n=1 Tax=Rana temporaria TaxID=8407 RepID=UPI001AADB552|nr:uncharacterized protein LOC120940291 isoform X2 [Rana temporaria]
MRQIHVYALPPAPVVSLEPSQDMYMAGQPVAMTCFTFRDHEQKILRFYKNGQKIFSLEYFTGNATLHIDTSLPGSGGNYSCDYQTKRLGTWISSITRTVFVNIPDQTTAGTTISTSSLLTMAFQGNGIVTSEAQETHITTGTATNEVSMASVSSTSNQDENAVAKTSPEIHFSTGIAVNSVSMVSVSSPSKQHENTDAKTIAPETHSSTASALLTSQNSMVSQWTNQTNLTTTSDPSASEKWIFYVIGGCVLLILLCVLLLRVYFSRKGNKSKPVNAPLWANNDIPDTKKSKRTYKETEIDMTAHIYSELDQSPPLMKLSSAPRPSASLGSLAHIKPSAVPVYSTVQAVSPLPCVYSTLLSQKPLQTSCPTLLQPENSTSYVN